MLLTNFEADESRGASDTERPIHVYFSTKNLLDKEIKCKIERKQIQLLFTPRYISFVLHQFCAYTDLWAVWVKVKNEQEGVLNNDSKIYNPS
ncbi:hypothetical protein CEXT_66371 [Caerostris extrusa]|uniref:Uncharacterized protein n=1 Tax=Caerostris extrusa TaxID=172846 RepID=A0AAV4WF49_CAEEX|nr:hypothetical protein CEXT_66371 [Caerostris extrusa]